MSVTVAIPTTLERPTVRSTVESALAAAAYDPHAEVLVMVNGTPPSPDPLAHLGSPQVRVLHLPRRSAPGARNAALETACHDTVLFTDDDCRLPATWCTDLATALHLPAEVAVAAPVRAEGPGPLLAYMNYQRLFDAPPDGAGGAAYVVTANCGVRRDRLPHRMRFDDTHFNNAAEDADFGLRLRAAGHSLRWLARSAPVTHRLSGAIVEISDRWLRYGRAHVRLHTRKRHPGTALGGVRRWYAAMCQDTARVHRCFSELADPVLREAFTAYDLILGASFLIGYLEELGSEWGRPLITVDHDKLTAGWDRVARWQEALVSATPDGPPPEVRPDYHRFGIAAGEWLPVPEWYTSLLQTYASPLPDGDGDTGGNSNGNGTSDGNANGDGTAYARDLAAFLRSPHPAPPGPTAEELHRAWTACPGGAPRNADEADRALRGAGACMREGGRVLEAYLPARPLLGSRT
ncbi:glycosyltransferase family 2 protein [Streptomyces sp. Ru73]|uniref:glycosyltransferase family 2 protein n=1 Tax=Streptomyces sp. Ru73 TaxID=2080748 RepID=UPI0011B0ED35|nr:glycosyltransferase [Streptomyces sp. Ru73]